MKPRAGAAAVVLLACVAACSVYGEDEDEAPPITTLSDAGQDGTFATADGQAVGSDGGVDIDVDASAMDATSSATDAGLDAGTFGRDLYVFITSVSIKGKITSANPQTVGDQLCNQLKLNNSKIAGRDFVAWLATVNATPQKRIAEKAVGHRYIRIDGMVVTASPLTMTNDVLEKPIVIDESGALVTAQEVWTGTLTNGTTSPANCVNWTSDGPGHSAVVGQPNSTRLWMQGGYAGCNGTRPIYCFEVP